MRSEDGVAALVSLKSGFPAFRGKDRQVSSGVVRPQVAFHDCSAWSLFAQLYGQRLTVVA